jgi:hypothetical protein
MVPVRKRRRTALVVLAGVVLVAVNVFAVRDLVSTRAASADVRDEQSRTRDATARRESDVATAGSRLDATTAQLAVRTADRDRTRAAGKAAVSKLSAARADLGVQAGRVAMQVGQITTLTECLQGVSRAMNGLSVGDDARGLAALHDVDVACQRAATIGTGP